MTASRAPAASEPLDLVLRAPRAVLPEGERPVAVGVRDGRIESVAALDAPLPARHEVRLAVDEVLLPGLVDSHVHVNEPGRTEWEGFVTATRAAAAGGVTTIVDMPLNSLPPTVDTDALEVKRAAAAGRVHVDTAFWGGIVPGNLERLPDLHAAGVLGFKCFLADSGVPEFPPLSPAELDAALTLLAGLDALTVVHAEDAGTLARSAAACGPSYRGFLATRPPEAETTAVRQLVAAARRTGARVHVLHLSAAEAVPVIAAAQREGVRITAETCPHYLALTAESVPDGATAAKCCPPVRDDANRDALWSALGAGVVGAVVTDHSPSPPGLKRLDTGEFDLAWGGIASLQLGLAVVWTEARRRGVTLTEVVRWMGSGPADLAGLTHKGRLAERADADLVVLAPDERFVVDPASLHHRHPVTPYAGHELAGVVRATYLGGRLVDGAAPAGRLLSRPGPA